MEAKVYLDADEYLRDCWRLAAAVRDSGWRPTVILALWRGGAPVGVAVQEFLKVCGLELRHIPVKCSSYAGIGAGSNAGAVNTEGLDAVLPLVGSGDRVLVADDVFDTGKTAAAVLPRLAATGAEARLACVYFKRANNLTGGRPDYFVREIGGEWLVFPHELEGLSADELKTKDPLVARLLGD